MNKRDSISKDTIIAGISLLVSVATLFFTNYQYNRRNSDSIESKQIDFVTELVEHIETTFIRTDLIHRDGTGWTNIGSRLDARNIFGLAEENFLEDLDTCKIVFRYEEHNPVSYYNYVLNPLLPKKIADKLYELQAYESNDVIIDSLQGYYFLFKDWTRVVKRFAEQDSILEHGGEVPLSKKRVSPEGFYYTEGPLKNWKSFKKYNKELYRIIVKWLNDHGVEDVNVRRDKNITE